MERLHVVDQRGDQHSSLLACRSLIDDPARVDRLGRPENYHHVRVVDLLRD
jgi:hypothetical protein